MSIDEDIKKEMKDYKRQEKINARAEEIHRANHLKARLGIEDHKIARQLKKENDYD